MSADRMTSRERLLAALRGEPVDRVPWSPCVDGYFLSSLPDDHKLDEAGLHREVGADALLRHVMVFSSTAPTMGLLSRARENPRIEVDVERLGGARFRVVYRTQVGELCEEFEWTPESPNIPWFTKRKLETVDDVKVYMYALETASVRSEPRAFRRTVESLGEDGLVTTSGPASPMEQLINLEMGVENLTYALADDPETLRQCFGLMHDFQRKAYDAIASSEAEVVISYENLSTTLTSRRNYTRFDREHCNDYAAICHDAGKLYLTHMCGKLHGFAEQLCAAEQDGFIDVAPAPTGDVHFGEAKAGWARDKVLVGGIDATAFTGLSPDGMRRYVHDRLDEIERESGGFYKFILGSGDALPKDTPLDVVRAVGGAVRERSATV
jgi:uroporphyrinogen-III decarboxylase